MDNFRTEVVIDRPLSQVWAAFVDPSSWASWYGVELLRVEPSWQAGATIHWKLGDPSQVVAAIDQQMVKIRDSLGGRLKGPETEWVFSTVGGGTRVELIEDYSQADSLVTDALAHQRGMSDTLGKLKTFMEAVAPETRPRQESDEEKRSHKEMMSLVCLFLWIVVCTVVGYVFLGECAGAFGTAFVGMWIGGLVRNWVMA